MRRFDFFSIYTSIGISFVCVQIIRIWAAMPLPTLLIIGLVLMVAIFLATQLFQRNLAAYHARQGDEFLVKFTTAAEQLQNNLSKQEVVNLAKAMLNDEEKFHCIRATNTIVPNHEKLPAGLLELFAMYDSIQSLRSEGILEREMIGISSYGPDYLKIGEGLECDIAIQSEKEHIFFLDGGAVEGLESYPSIYHWILTVGQR